jgi:hypothetical protein
VKDRTRKYKTHSKIARYWMQWEIDNKQVPPFGDFDWGEPSCMACKYSNEEWEAKTEARKHKLNMENLDHVSWTWNDTTLERCHIVPRYMGGSDDVENLVLMCGKCHAQHPDWAEPEKTFAWMRSRRGAYIREVLAEMGLNI